MTPSPLKRLRTGLTILAFLLFVLLLSPMSLPKWIRNAAYASAGLYFVVLSFLIWLKVRTEQALVFVQILIKPFPPKMKELLTQLLNSFIQGLKILQHKGHILISVLLSILVWVPVAGVIHILLGAVGVSLPLYVSFFLLSVLCIGIMVPSGPGYVGTIQFICVACLTLFGIPRNTALSFSVLYHASQFIPLTIIGLITIFIEGLNLGQLGTSVEEEETGII